MMLPQGVGPSTSAGHIQVPVYVIARTEDEQKQRCLRMSSVQWSNSWSSYKIVILPVPPDIDWSWSFRTVVKGTDSRDRIKFFGQIIS
jgi:hypothetical protein